MIHFQCPCGNALFFENSICVQCGAQVGYDVAGNRMIKLDGKVALQRCRNGVEYGICNWIVPQGSRQPYCRSCQLTRTAPDLSQPFNLESWKKMENAKRRVIYTLARLGLSPLSRSESAAGLAFDFLAPLPGMRVMTGHIGGVITINVHEADDVYRETERRALGEPYRTLIGHFRHELGHYYWDRIFGWRDAQDPFKRAFQHLFGNEQVNYLAALQQHYFQGPPAGWAATYISGYAAAHPWEDWAETWAQYLNIVDALETARNFGWMSEQVPMPFTPFAAPDGPQDADSREFLATINEWMKMAPALNEIAASLGHPNLYPFIFSLPTVEKILFVHKVVASANRSVVTDETAAA